MNIQVKLILLVALGLCLWIDPSDAQRKKGSKKGKKDPCHLREAESCMNKIQSLSKRKDPSSLIASNEAIREDLSKCVKNFLKKCGTPLHREIFDLIIDQMDLSISRFCDPKNAERTTFLKHSPCIHKKVLSQDEYKTTCNNNFLAAVDKIDGSGTQDADQIHSIICCGYNRWHSCTDKIIVKECGKEAEDSFTDFVGDSFGTLTKMMCPTNLFSTKKELCKSVLPKESVKAKGKLGENALTKYVVSLFSFLFVFDQ
ncbi:hypothetical protein QR98_0054790 [Sarcoptes scabiei]|uniref:Uncharacterized protein n=1 Tax=Sarcoptes scabiei TaxID=52283 RepID=A0A132A7U6_SARSC|nr:hypothetical protein QR98_0054790 [Sarcoptes scabiei]